MGDRRMAEIRTSRGSLYVYTHWNGHQFAEDAAKAIVAAHARWGDEPYAVRIMVDQLTKEGRDQETGFGLLLQPDAEDSYNSGTPSIVIDLPKRELTVRDEGKSGVTEAVTKGFETVVRQNHASCP